MTRPADWIGRTETDVDWASPSALTRFGAMLDHDERPAEPGDPIRPLAHWLFFLPHDRQSAVGADGHGERGGFLPAAPELPRRMWAGSRISFAGTIRAGMALTRESRISNVAEKAGRSGRLLFVTVRHSIAEPGGRPLLIEEHDIVYRPLSAAALAEAPGTPPSGRWRRSLVPDQLLLFRYSALTFNGHRIHYDLPYATADEGYPGLVVHGPLVATLMIDLLARNLPEARILRFAFRATSPLFVGNALTLHGERSEEDKVSLWTTNHEGRLAMTAEAAVERLD